MITDNPYISSFDVYNLTNNLLVSVEYLCFKSLYISLARASFSTNGPLTTSIIVFQVTGAARLSKFIHF